MLFNEMTLSKEFFLRRIGGMLLHVSSRNVNGPLHVERVKLQLPRTIHNAGKKRLYIFFISFFCVTFTTILAEQLRRC